MKGFLCGRAFLLRVLVVVSMSGQRPLLVRAPSIQVGFGPQLKKLERALQGPYGPYYPANIWLYRATKWPFVWLLIVRI